NPGGDINLNNGGHLAFSGNQSFDNSINFGSGTGNVVSVQGNSVLTLGPHLALSGSRVTIYTDLASGRGTIAKQAGLSADGAGTIYNINSASLINDNILEARNGGKLYLDYDPATQSNTGGDITNDFVGFIQAKVNGYVGIYGDTLHNSGQILSDSTGA